MVLLPVQLRPMVYLTWASPRFNPANEVARWDSAAVNAKKVMDFKLNVDGPVTNGFKPANSLNWFDPNSHRNCIFSTLSQLPVMLWNVCSTPEVSRVMES